jgi:hypothetical protein
MNSAGKRVDFDLVLRRKKTREDLDVGPEIRIHLDHAKDAEAEAALHHESDRAVGHAHDLWMRTLDHAVQVVRARRLHGGILLGHDADEPPVCVLVEELTVLSAPRAAGWTGKMSVPERRMETLMDLP